MRSNHVATIYLKGRGVQNQIISTGPGRRVSIIGGAAKVVDPRDMPALLQLAGVQVEVESDYADQIPLWKSLCPQQRPAVADIVVVGEPVEASVEVKIIKESGKQTRVKHPPRDSGTWTPPSTDELDALLA